MAEYLKVKDTETIEHGEGVEDLLDVEHDKAIPTIDPRDGRSVLPRIRR